MFIIEPTPRRGQLHAETEQVSSLFPQVMRYLGEQQKDESTLEVPVQQLFDRVSDASSRLVMRATVWRVSSGPDFALRPGMVEGQPQFVLRRAVI